MPRYRLLDTPRSFAQGLLQAAGEQAAVQARHAAAMRQLYAQARSDLFGGRVGIDELMDSLDPDVDNGMLALRWAHAQDLATALEIAPTLARGMATRRADQRRQLWELIEPLLDDPASPDRLGPTLLGRAAAENARHWLYPRPALAIQRALQAEAWAQQAGDAPTQYLALSQRAWACGARGDAPGLQQCMAAMATLKDARWAPFVDAQACDHELWPFVLAADWPGAMASLRDQSRRRIAAGMNDNAQVNNLATALLGSGQIDEAIQAFQRLVTLADGERDPYILRNRLYGLLGAYLQKQAVAEARHTAQRLWPLAQRYDLVSRWARSAALLAALEGRPHAALQLLGYSDAAFAAEGMAVQATHRLQGSQTLARAQADLAAGGDTTDPAALQRQGAALPVHALEHLAFGPGPN